MGVAATPEAILKELAGLWESLAKSDADGILRACSMTLIIAADEEEEAAMLGEMVAEVMHNHPSRAIVLRVRDGLHRTVDARVFAQCWKPLGRRQQICCEQIEIRTTEGGLVDIPRLLLGLIAPDLPVVLICRKPKLIPLAGFQPLLQMAGKIILDSRLTAHPVDMMKALAHLRSTGATTDDLAWTAITPWREAIACTFQDKELLGQLAAIESIRVTHAGRYPSTQAYYLAAWLSRATGIRAGIEFQEGEAGAAVQGVAFAAPGLELGFAHTAGSLLKVSRNGIATQQPFALSSDWDLLREELSVFGHDSIFEEILAIAISLAGE